MEEPEPQEVVGEPDEDSPPAHSTIPTYEDELADSTANLDFPLSGAERMYEEEKKTFEEKGSRIEQEKSDETKRTTKMSQIRRRQMTVMMMTWQKFIKCSRNGDVAMEQMMMSWKLVSKQAERPQHNLTRLKNKMKRLGLKCQS